MQLDTLFPVGPSSAVNRLQTSKLQNIYEADFEYGKQPLRWEEFTAGSGTVTHMPRLGGTRMRLSGTAGDITIRQSRPYHRYQPGKAMFMATAMNFGTANANQVQRVGFFDDSNGIFIEQSDTSAKNPFGMYVVSRSDVGGLPVDTRVPLDKWNGDATVISSLDWTVVQMIWMEYAWYGAGLRRWGVYINGIRYVLHNMAHGNMAGAFGPWSRTGNLPVRYEQRNTGTSVQNDMYHYGVSVCVEGEVDEQRGFTYSYGMALQSPRRTVAQNTIRFPVLSIRMRNMGTLEYTQANAACTAGTTTSLTAGTASWTVDQWKGACVAYIVAGVTYTARITTNTATVLTIADIVTGLAMSVAPVAGQNYTIGLISRGQLLPKKLTISASALAQCEIFLSTPTNPVVLTGANWQDASGLGALNSFAQRDVSATAMSGGELVKKFTLPAGGSGLQEFDLSELFALYNNIKGNTTDILCLAVTTQGSVQADVGADFDAQEAMS